MVVNAVKLYIMLFGHLGHNVQLPAFQFGNDTVSVVPETTYVGFHIASEGNILFAPHYSIEASKAEVVGNVILGLHKMIGSLNPWEAKKLYMALVDPHLTYGCEIIVDTKHGQGFWLDWRTNRKALSAGY